MSRWHRWSLNALAAIMVMTGVVYFVMKYLMDTDDPFALVNHPLQPAMLELHVLAAPAFILVFGIVYESHIAGKIRSGYRVNRRTGLLSLVTFGVMVASGYLLQVLSAPAWVGTALVTHLVSGAIFAVCYGAHLVIGLRQDRNADKRGGALAA